MRTVSVLFWQNIWRYDTKSVIKVVLTWFLFKIHVWKACEEPFQVLGIWVMFGDGHSVTAPWAVGLWEISVSCGYFLWYRPVYLVPLSILAFLLSLQKQSLFCSWRSRQLSKHAGMVWIWLRNLKWLTQCTCMSCTS